MSRVKVQEVVPRRQLVGVAVHPQLDRRDGDVVGARAGDGDRAGERGAGRWARDLHLRRLPVGAADGRPSHGRITRETGERTGRQNERDEASDERRTSTTDGRVVHGHGLLVRLTPTDRLATSAGPRPSHAAGLTRSEEIT